MRCLKALLFSLFVISGLTAAIADERPFAHRGVAQDAERYETYLKENWKPGARPAADLRLAGDKALGEDPRAASRHYAAAVTADDKSAENWLGLARALLAITPDPNSGAERYDLPVNASGSAYRAYQLAKDPALKARTLAVLGEAMQRRSYWRPAIDALRASLSLVEATGVRETYEKLRAEQGFRMADYSTDSDAAQPRVCIRFSENLARGEQDFAKFVSVNGRDPEAVAAEGSQLCVEGVRHGERYEIALRAGLPSDVDEPLAKPVTLAVYVPDRKPMVHFTGRSYVLPSRGQQGIPLVAINTNKVEIEVYRIGDRSLATALTAGNFDRQLRGYEFDELKNRTGARVYTGTLDVASKLNAEVTVAFPVGEAIGELQPGAYAMIARPSEAATESWNEQATQWFIVSDLGLTALSGDDGVHAFVRSLANADPVADAEVRLVARNNEILATAKTDKTGYARFEPGQSRGEGGNAPAILVAQNGAGEYAFLDLTTNAFDLSDRGVKGRDASGPIDAFLYTERGVYRPGEEVNVTGLVRDNIGNAVTLPVTLIVTRPDGVEHGRYPLADQGGLGARAHTIALAGGAMTGTWRARLHADPKADALTQVTFLVEDYVPERLDLTLADGAGRLAPGAVKTVDLTGRYLYGPPAANLVVEGDILVRPSTKDLDGFAGYRFGQADEQVSPVRQPLEGLPNTSDDGTAALPVMLPAVTKTARPLEANVIVRLRETGGRTIERSITLPVALGEPRVGIKQLFPATGLPEGEKARFEAILLDGDDKPANAKLDWQLLRLDTSWQWYSRDGSWAYESQTITKKVAAGTVDTTAATPAAIAAEVGFGRYRLEVSASGSGGAALSTLVFNAGWYTGGDSADSPEVLEVALDKETYKAGDTAKLRIASRHGGKALVTVLGQGLLSAQEIEIAAGGGEVAIPVGENWGAGAYATAMLYRPMDEGAKRMPGRAIGVRWIGIDQAPRTLNVALETADQIKSTEGLKVPVKIAGLTPGEEARVTVAAVDVGILNLTRFQAPAPERHFYAQHKLALELRDFYGRLIDGMRAERGTLRSGGDGMGGSGLQASPPVEETVSLYSGIVTVAQDGTASVDFALPPFNGTVRLMAVAWTNTKLGHATRDIVVRDAVALTVSVPRFLTLGDEATVDLSLHNVDGPAGPYKASVSGLIDDAPFAEKVLDLSKGERKSAQVKLKPHDVGTFVYDVNVTGPNDIAVSRRLQFDVKPPAGDIKRSTVATLAAKGGKLTLSKDLLAGMIANRTRVNVSVGPAAHMDVPGLLTSLDRYPYGCAEQTVSRALPLLYVNAVAKDIGFGADHDIKTRVEQAITRVFDMQDASGAFGGWSPANGDLWLTSYVTDFLTRAREQGYVVRDLPFRQALDRLQNFALNSDRVTGGGEERAYALYVLARNGRAPMGELRYEVDTRLESFTTPLAKAQLGAALAMVGDKERSERAFTAALDAFDAADKLDAARTDYGSEIRDGAALLTLATESRVVRNDTPRLVNVVSRAYTARSYTSTQEQAWMLLAAHALGEDAKKAQLSIDGTPVNGAIQRAYSAHDLENGITVSNDGDASIDAVVTVIGAALSPEPAVSKGFSVTRSYYTLAGEPVDLESASGSTGELAQNQRLVAVLKVESDEAAGRILLVDRLPAGLEIENPRLVDSGDIKSLSWLKTTLRPEHTEFRDDRFVAAFNLWNTARRTQNADTPAAGGDDLDDEDNGGGEDDADDGGRGDTTHGIDTDATLDKVAASATVAYVVRAVTPGTFVHPAATVEDMYRPERHARSASGTLTVTNKD